MNIFEALRADHDIQRELCSALLETAGDSPERKELYQRLKKELVAHADAEERFFYKQLIDSDMTQEHARHGMAEHHEMDDLIAALDETEMSSPAWLTNAKKLADKVEHHLEDEERTFFQLAGKVFSDAQKENLAGAYRSHMDKEGLGKAMSASLPTH